MDPKPIAERQSDSIRAELPAADLIAKWADHRPEILAALRNDPRRVALHAAVALQLFAEGGDEAHASAALATIATAMNPAPGEVPSRAECVRLLAEVIRDPDTEPSVLVEAIDTLARLEGYHAAVRQVVEQAEPERRGN